MQALFIGLTAFGSDPWRVERLYVRGFGPPLASLPDALSRAFPFSLAEPVFVLALVGALAWLAHRVRGLLRGPGSERLRAAVRALVEAWTAVLAVVCLFSLVWGLAYRRPPLDHRQAWRPPDAGELEVSPVELADLGLALVHQVNALYLDVHGLPDGFAPTTAEAAGTSLLATDAAIDVGFTRLPEVFPGETRLALSRGPTKPLASSALFTRLRIGGMYFPFTAEANVNRLAPEWQRPFTMAHEKAHQRFVAWESEANFFGMMACVHSDDLFARYSGWLFAQRQVLRALQDVDPWAFAQIIQQRLPGVQRDVNFSYAFWTDYQGTLSELSHAVNDAYLRANRVPGGVRSYSRSLQLIVMYARRNPWPGPWPDHERDMGSRLEVR